MVGVSCKNTHNGIVWYNKEINFGSLAIPKCGSTSLRIQFNLTETCHVNEYEGTPIAFIKHPIDRFVSSFMEIMVPYEKFPRGRFKDTKDFEKQLKVQLYSLDHEDTIPKLIKFIPLIEKYGYFDIHLVKQIDFIRDIKTKSFFKNTVVIKLNEADIIEQYIGDRLQKNNQTTNSEIKRYTLDYLDRRPDLKRRIESLYDEDFEFYNSFKNKIVLK